MYVEGRIKIDLTRAADGSGHARISSRPQLGIARAFAGRRVDDAVRTLPTLFSVCGLAQGAVAVTAAEEAMGLRPSPATGDARLLLLLAEIAREHLLRLLADGGRHQGSAPPNSTLKAMRAFEGIRRVLDPNRTALSIAGDVNLDRSAILYAIDQLQDVIESLALGVPLVEFAAHLTLSDIRHWQEPQRTPAQVSVGRIITEGWSDAGDCRTAFLPRLDDSSLAGLLLDGDETSFARAPTWDGRPCETSALGRQIDHPLVADIARHSGSGLLARLTARLVELASLPDRMRHILSDGAPDDDGLPALRSSSPSTGRGLAHVEAARGRLTHGIDVRQGAVARYAILAPTEWNFHPDGICRDGLSAIAGRPGDVASMADYFVTALDPCVAFDVRIH